MMNDEQRDGGRKPRARQWPKWLLVVVVGLFLLVVFLTYVVRVRIPPE